MDLLVAGADCRGSDGRIERVATDERSLGRCPQLRDVQEEGDQRNCEAHHVLRHGIATDDSGTGRLPDCQDKGEGVL